MDFADRVADVLCRIFRVDDIENPIALTLIAVIGGPIVALCYMLQWALWIVPIVLIILFAL